MDLAVFEQVLGNPDQHKTGVISGAIDLYRGPFLEDLSLRGAADVGASPGNYEVVASAVSQSSPTITANVTDTVAVLNRGVQLEIVSGPTTIDPRNSAVWQVQVTNTGQVADTFDLQAVGPLALVGTLLFSGPSCYTVKRLALVLNMSLYFRDLTLCSSKRPFRQLIRFRIRFERPFQPIRPPVAIRAKINGRAGHRFPLLINCH